MKIVDRSGRSVSAEVDLAKGEPENPASWEEINRKFFANATQLLSREVAGQLAERIVHLEEISVEEMVGLL